MHSVTTFLENQSSDGTFVPVKLSFRGTAAVEQKVVRTFVPWNFRTRRTFASQERMSQELSLHGTSFPGTFTTILKKIGESITAICP